MESSSQALQIEEKSLIRGTLAIDLGNSTTVVAFQSEKEENPQLLDLPPITRTCGETPSLIGYRGDQNSNVLIGQEVLNFDQSREEELCICSDFKRWIGSDKPFHFSECDLLPEKAGELLIERVWHCLPPQLEVKRLVLTAPVDSYRGYKTWLYSVCRSLPVDEVALVDEPTAAAIGAGLVAGSKLLVIDLGGSTIDLSLVALEGGEGRAEPIAELLRFGGEDLEGKSSQIVRCAKVLGKAGQRLGGRDFDKWIADYLLPNEELTDDLLNAAERLKCRLSEEFLIGEVLEESFQNPSRSKTHALRLNRAQFEALLVERGLLRCLESLLSQTLKNAALNNCTLKDLQGAVLVGGGARIPLIRKWFQQNTQPAPLLTPPPIEAVAKGALSLTPGVTIRDLLQRGASLRCWDKKSQMHIWHPLFVAGQPWPTSKGLQIVLSASSKNQEMIELVIGEPDIQVPNEVVYINGIPTIRDQIIDSGVNTWDDKPVCFFLNPPGQQGEDCLKLIFSINSAGYLEVEGQDIRSGEKLKKQTLGLVR